MFSGMLHVLIRFTEQNTNTQEHQKVTSNSQLKDLLISFSLSVLGPLVTAMCLFFPSAEQDTVAVEAQMLHYTLLQKKSVSKAEKACTEKNTLFSSKYCMRTHCISLPG